MPDAQAIHDALTRIAQGAASLAVAWHVALAVVLGALLVGWRPSQRLAALLLAVPLASVAALAWFYESRFNAALLGSGAAVLSGLALRLPREPVRPASSGLVLVAGALLALGWLYPHFLDGRAAAAFLYEAPLGLLPCPTLAAVVGLAILARGFEARAWSSVLAGLGLFNGVFGSMRLGVFIDTFLTIGAVVLLGVVWSRHDGVAHDHARVARSGVET